LRPGRPAIASLRAHLLVQILKRTVKRRLARANDLAAERRIANRVWRRPPRGVTVRPERLGGVPGEWLSARDVDEPVLLYIHGGAYVMCSPATHRALTGAFARWGFRVYAPDYRLAPEHPFPAALDDVVAVYSALLARGLAPNRIVLGGESAGGALVLSLMLRLRALGLPQPAAAIAFSPWTDLAATGPSLTVNTARDAMFDGATVARTAQLYLGEASPRDPLASPLFADLAGLPPLLIHVGADEVLRDDSTRLAAKAKAAGVDVTLEIWPVVPHGWQVFHGLIPEARHSVERAAAFLNRHVDAASEVPRPAIESPQAARSRA
jgi:monoterpene epsilon-lactone hydrolase